MARGGGGAQAWSIGPSHRSACFRAALCPGTRPSRRGAWRCDAWSWTTAEALLHALQGCTELVIATGARPSINLAGPLQVDAWGVQAQVQACRSLGLKRVVLVSSLCAGRWLHPLNLFGLILVWKRLGERCLERSGLDWTVIRPGGLSEDDSRSTTEGVLVTDADQQQSNSIPRRLVAQVCLDALEQPQACGRILEITSSPAQPQQPLGQWLDQSA